MDPLELLERMKYAPALRRLPLVELDRLARLGVVRELAPGELLLEEGKPTADVYLLLAGSVAIRKRGEDAAQRKIATRAEADWLGEIAALDDGMASATVVVEERVQALVFPRQVFLEVLTRDAGAVVDLLRTVVARLRESDSRLIAALDQRVRALRSRNEDLSRENRRLLRAIDERCGFEHFIGTSASARAVRQVARSAAESDLPLLLLGETGTGKELLARAIHRESERGGRPFVVVNCALLAPPLLESELFGHARGAFTGATQGKTGLVEAANGGALFLDEIGDMPLPVQAALLRFLESGEYRRLGEVATRRADVHVMAATHRRLDEEVAAGRFRADLFYRLDVLRVEIPPLRERVEDLPLLVAHCTERVAKRRGVAPLRLSPAALDALERYPFPGNVRELENEIERLSMTETPGSTVLPDRLSRRVRQGPSTRALTLGYAEATRAYKVRLVEEALREARGNKTRAAERLGLHRSNLARMIRDLGIPDPLE